MESSVDDATFDRLFAESAGVHLWTYLQVRLGPDQAERAGAVLEDAYARLVGSGALIHAGSSRAFRTRLYGLIDDALPHLGQPGLAQPLPAELRERAQAFREHVELQWHGLHAEHLALLRALSADELEAVLLRDFHGWSMHEIGRRLGMEREEARGYVKAIRDRLSGRAPRLQG